jgi:hypothetical protein
VNWASGQAATTGGKVSLKYSFTFLALAVACVFAGLVTWDVVRWGAGALLYAAFSFGLLSAAYAGAGPGLPLKRASGRQSAWAWLMFAPYFLLNAVTFRLYRLLSKEPAIAQVAPNLFFGRRLSGGEARATRWVGVLDLAGEFAEVRPLREVPAYRSLPVLDATAPTEEQLRSAAAWLARVVESGPVYVHCALGHGRSACVVIAYLLTAGRVGTAAEGAALLQSLRPGVRLYVGQGQRLRAFEPQPESAA